jgi:hypothetical protein
VKAYVVQICPQSCPKSAAVEKRIKKHGTWYLCKYSELTDDERMIPGDSCPLEDVPDELEMGDIDNIVARAKRVTYRDACVAFVERLRK